MNEEHIEELIRIKNDTIIQKYDDYNANSKTFVAPEWTLEYSLAKSPLVKLLWKSIHETRYKEPYSTTNKEKFDKINNLFTDGSESISAELAYNVFKSLNDKVVSKAIVAQKLAIEIGNLDNEGKEQLKSEVLSNKYTQYLVDAIKHAAQINEEEGCTDE